MALRFYFVCCGILAATVLPRPSAVTQVERPRILGVAHLAVFVSDLDAARRFYEGLLGYDVPLTLPGPDGAVDTAIVRINDTQSIELLNQPARGEGQLSHIALRTDDAERMRRFLSSRSLAVPERVVTDRAGHRSFTVADPEGHDVEFVEYQAGNVSGVPTANAGGRVSAHAIHVGILTGRLDAAQAFYAGILGFSEFWRGSAASSKTLSWVNMRVPEGTDYLELMLYGDKPAPDRRGSAHHICLVVPDIARAVAHLDARPARRSYTRPLEIRTGINRKRQVNLFDPDGTRVELMEPDTIDGQPAPPSPLPPPR